MTAAKTRPARQRKSLDASEAKQIESFLAKYTPEMVRAGKQSRARMRDLLPGGIECGVAIDVPLIVFVAVLLEYQSDVMLTPGPKISTHVPIFAHDAFVSVLSVALMPRWVTLCFLKGAKLSDPKKLLRGSGNIVRNIHLTSPAQIDEPDVMDLVQQAIAAAAPPFPGDGTRLRTIIKSISAKQRPRRPR